MTALPFELIQSYRAKSFRLLPGHQLKTQDEAVDFVKSRGFVFFWPIRDVVLPSLWKAVAGDRPVADAHDDPGHITWGWKDGLLGSRAWYYGKILRKKATMISMELVPYFYALSENYGSPEEDYLTQYEQGRMTLEARQVYEAILKQGPLDTIALRKESRLASLESESRFNKALADLQSDFKIVPVAVTQAGAWRYAFAYDIAARHYPEVPEQARFIGELDARKAMARSYFASVGAARSRELTLLFGWSPAEVEKTLDQLAREGFIKPGISFENQPGVWHVISAVFPG